MTKKHKKERLVAKQQAQAVIAEKSPSAEHDLKTATNRITLIKEIYVLRRIIYLGRLVKETSSSVLQKKNLEGAIASVVGFPLAYHLWISQGALLGLGSASLVSSGVYYLAQKILQYFSPEAPLSIEMDARYFLTQEELMAEKECLEKEYKQMSSSTTPLIPLKNVIFTTSLCCLINPYIACSVMGFYYGSKIISASSGIKQIIYGKRERERIQQQFNKIMQNLHLPTFNSAYSNEAKSLLLDLQLQNLTQKGKENQDISLHKIIEIIAHIFQQHDITVLDYSAQELLVIAQWIEDSKVSQITSDFQKHLAQGKYIQQNKKRFIEQIHELKNILGIYPDWYVIPKLEQGLPNYSFKLVMPARLEEETMRDKFALLKQKLQETLGEANITQQDNILTIEKLRVFPADSFISIKTKLRTYMMEKTLSTASLKDELVPSLVVKEETPSVATDKITRWGKSKYDLTATTAAAATADSAQPPQVTEKAFQFFNGIASPPTITPITAHYLPAKEAIFFIALSNALEDKLGTAAYSHFKAIIERGRMVSARGNEGMVPAKGEIKIAGVRSQVFCKVKDPGSNIRLFGRIVETNSQGKTLVYVDSFNLRAHQRTSGYLAKM
ncbi:MAG: hypothetical protein K0S08_1224 [Gammaproteobacteria bacterium]|jgi:hypothetical protein|nr:hypothetical protein [Gammaproteobacteria bacterium]